MKPSRFDEKKARLAEQKWLDTYKAPAKIDGRYIYPVDDYIYAPAGGFKEIGKKLLKD